MKVLQIRHPVSSILLPEVNEITLGAPSLIGQSLGEAHIRERFGVTIVSITRSWGRSF